MPVLNSSFNQCKYFCGDYLSDLKIWKGRLVARSKHWIWVLAEEPRRSKTFRGVPEERVQQREHSVLVGGRAVEKSSGRGQDLQAACRCHLQNLHQRHRSCRGKVWCFFTFPKMHSQVSLDSKVKQNLMLKKENPPRDIFEEAQTKIFSLMHRDSYPRWAHLNIYDFACISMFAICP